VRGGNKAEILFLSFLRKCLNGIFAFVIVMSSLNADVMKRANDESAIADMGRQD